MEARLLRPHNLALEVVDDHWEVGIQQVTALGHKQLQGENITLLLQELAHRVLGGSEETGCRGDNQADPSKVCARQSPWMQAGHPLLGHQS